VQKGTAKEIAKCVIMCIDELNKMLFTVRERCSDDEFKALRRGVGYVMSELQDRITDPVYREHPDLIPPEAGYVPRSGPTLSEIATKKS
jgi:hypothetical protein